MFLMRINGREIDIIIPSIDKIDVVDMIRIDYGNIIGEVLTIDIMLVSVGIVRAEAEDAVRRLQLGVDIYSAKYKSKYRDDGTVAEYNSARKLVTKKPTVSEIDDALKHDIRYIKLKKRLNKAMHDSSIVSEVYWSLKGKSDKLSVFKQTVKLDDYKLDDVVAAVEKRGASVIMSKLHN